MAADPQYAATPATVSAQLTAANTARDGTGSNIVTVLTAAATGTRILAIDIMAQVTTTAGAVRLWIVLDSGPTFRLFDEVLVPAVTPSVTLKAFRVRLDFTSVPLILSTGYSLRAATNNAEAINVHALAASL